MENGFKKSDVVPELLNLGCSIDYNEYELGNILSVHCGEIDFSIYFLTIVFGPVPGTEIHSVPLCKFSKKNLKNLSFIIKNIDKFYNHDNVSSTIKYPDLRDILMVQNEF